MVEGCYKKGRLWVVIEIFYMTAELATQLYTCESPSNCT
jgi:hypothetical protein